MKWHYDISFWPHTNYSPLTVGTYLYDCSMDQGPLAVLPRSHEIEPMLSQYGDDGKWTGCLGPQDLERLDLSRAQYLTGPAGSLTLHNCRTLHSSPRNLSDLGRPAAAQHVLVGGRLSLYRESAALAASTRRSCAASPPGTRTTIPAHACCRRTGRAATARSSRCSSEEEQTGAGRDDVERDPGSAAAARVLP